MNKDLKRAENQDTEQVVRFQLPLNVFIMMF